MDHSVHNSQLSATINNTRKIIDLAKRLIAPSKCLSCSEWLIDDAIWCHNCWPNVPFISNSTCPTCCKPEAHAATRHYSCPSCQTHMPLYSNLLSLYYYQPPIMHLVKQLKYQQQIHIANTIAKYWIKRFNNELKDYELLVPIPLHWRRLVWRGYNQSYELAKRLHKLSNIPLIDALKKVHATPSQTRATRQKRIENLSSAFALRSKFASRIKGSKVLIIDDVLTTGATASAASKILLKAGAKEVGVMTIAVTPLPHWNKTSPQEEEQ